MAANGYFQVVAEDGRMWLKIFAPEEGEVDISPEMVMKYLDAISFPDYDHYLLEKCQMVLMFLPQKHVL